jgi:hypothetical protein
MDRRIKSGDDDVTASSFKQPSHIRPVLRPGCVAFHLFCISFPRKNAGGAERRWTLPLKRDPPLPKAANLQRGRHATECCLRNNIRAHARRRSTTQTSLRCLRCFCGGFCPRNRSDKPGDARDFPVLVPAMAASYGGLRVVGAGRSTGASRDVIASHTAGAAPAGLSANPRRLIRPRLNRLCRSTRERGRSTNRTPHDGAPDERGGFRIHGLGK